jgi:hypothetical protein
VVIVRATKKLRQRIGAPTVMDGERSTTVLGDWYATSLPWRPQVALLVNEATLLPVLMPLVPAATMMARLADEVATVLGAHGVPEAMIRAEREHMRQYRIAATANRSVVGIMNEFTFLADAYRNEIRPDLLALAVRLARTPCSPLYRSHGSPDRALAALVGSGWLKASRPCMRSVEP